MQGSRVPSTVRDLLLEREDLQRSSLLALDKEAVEQLTVKDLKRYRIGTTPPDSWVQEYASRYQANHRGGYFAEEQTVLRVLEIYHRTVNRDIAFISSKAGAQVSTVRSILETLDLTYTSYGERRV
jgi:hypothetical protein